MKLLLSILFFTQQIFASNIYSRPLPGTVVMMATTSCPASSLQADGSSLLRTTYAQLFSAIGTTYGAVDGTHFTLPNTKGVFVRGKGSQVIGGNTYAGTQGTSLPDTTKKNGLSLNDPGHHHTYTRVNATGGAGAGIYADSANGGLTNNFNLYMDNAFTGVTINTGDSETSPANITLIYCIWY